jgi:hypothetical protein
METIIAAAPFAILGLLVFAGLMVAFSLNKT